MLEEAKGIRVCARHGHLTVVMKNGREETLASKLPGADNTTMRSVLELVAETHNRTLGNNFRVDDTHHMFLLN